MKKKVAILGPEGTFSEEAAIKINPDWERLHCNTIADVFETVLLDRAAVGVVPVENSLEGSVSATLELLLNKEVSICTEIVLDINHCLLALPGTTLGKIKEVISHPHALAQCRDFLRSMGDIKTRNFPSTAEAAMEVASKHLVDTAAIAPKIAARLYGLSVLSEGIQDHERNQTRFFVISKKCLDHAGKKKTSLIIGLKDRAGALYEILGHFTEVRVNLTKIESRPTKKSLGDYIFYIDFMGDVRDEKIEKILKDVKEYTTFFKVLGCYSSE